MCDKADVAFALTLLVRIVVVFDQRNATDDVVGDGLGARKLQSRAHGGALPDGDCTHRICRCGLGPRGEKFLDDGFACAELANNGDDAPFSGGSDAAIGCVVAEPDDVGDDGVEVGEMDGSNVAADAVDHEPRAGLPSPANGFGGKRVVDAEGAADNEGAVRDVVNFSDCPLLLYVVDVEWADAEGGRVFGFRIGRGLWEGVGYLAHRAEGDRVDLGGLGDSGDRKKEEQRHQGRTESLHAWKIAEESRKFSDAGYRDQALRARCKRSFQRR